MAKINTIFTFNSGVATSLVAIANGKQYTADSSHANWSILLDAIRNDDVDTLVKNIDVKSAFENYTVGRVRIVGNEVFCGNTKLGGVVVDRIFDFMNNNLPVEPIMRFIDKLFQNPSSRAVNELYKFLEHKNMPITSDGNFRAYKGLKADFYSCTAGKLTLLQGIADKDGYIYNGVGQVIECLRHQVNDNKDETCSYGLHAGSLSYASGFAQGKLVIVEINPKDVVSIPSDCNGEKLRTCKYTVVEEYTAPLNNVYVKTSNETFEEVDGVCDAENCNDSDREDGYDMGYDDGYAGCERSTCPGESKVFRDAYNEGYNDGDEAAWIEENTDNNDYGW